MVGPGAVGLALADALVARAGWRLVGVVGRTSAGSVRGASQLDAPSLGTSRAPRNGLGSAEVLLITVPDGAVAQVAADLAAFPGLTARVALPSSGSLPASALRPLRARGVALGSCHPVMTFPRDSGGRTHLPPDTPFGVEGEPRALRLARALASAVGAGAVAVPASGKALHHAAATLAGNLTVALLGAGAALLEAAGVPGRESFLMPLARESLLAAARSSAAAALTGPVARGDAETVRRHVEALRDAGLPRSVRLAHVAASLLAAAQVRARKRAPPRGADPAAVEDILEDALRSLQEVPSLPGTKAGRRRQGGAPARRTSAPRGGKATGPR